MINNNEIWQVDVNGQIYETNFTGLAEWINEGSLLPKDKVRRGHLRWVEAGKVSLLYGFFNAKELGTAPPVVPIVNTPLIEQTLPPGTENVVVSNNVSQPNVVKIAKLETSQQNHQVKTPPNYTPNPNADVCALHADAQPRYICETCANVFCNACPHTYSSVKICPFCGAMCQLLVIVKEKEKKVDKVSNGFGFMAFANALGYPLRFPVSFILGAGMYMFFTLGQSASAVGGIYLLVGSIFCAMLANTLTFGILANAVENMAQGKMALDFMPRFDEFSLWDDVIHPFFLSIGVYIVSFGLLFALIVGGTWYASSPNTAETNKVLIEKSKQIGDAKRDERIIENGEMVMAKNALTAEQQRTATGGDMNKLQDLMQEQRKKEIDSAFDNFPEIQRFERQAIIQNLMQFNLPFLILAGLAFLWGIFYFPVACAVAGYTRSFTAVVNPAVGLDTIKHLGFEYVKILLTSLILVISWISANLILGTIFASLNLPLMGNIPAVAVGSIIHFYIWIVFSVILGLILHKNSARLNLSQVNTDWSVDINRTQA